MIKWEHEAKQTTHRNFTNMKQNKESFYKLIRQSAVLFFIHIFYILQSDLWGARLCLHLKYSPQPSCSLIGQTPLICQETLVLDADWLKKFWDFSNTQSESKVKKRKQMFKTKVINRLISRFLIRSRCLSSCCLCLCSLRWWVQVTNFFSDSINTGSYRLLELQ